MELGAKLKAARIAAKLTQEQAAAQLAVSRQTMSNWENNRTYPDIISVVKMSDLYGVSLDHLLKGEDGAADGYVEYLGEVTDVVKNKKQLTAVVLAVAYLAIWAMSLLVFWLLMDSGDAMGYSLIFLVILLPVTTFVISLLASRLLERKRWIWTIPAVMGILYMLAQYATFSTANMIAFDKIKLPQWELLFIGAAISAAGMLAGAALRKMKAKKQ